MHHIKAQGMRELVMDLRHVYEAEYLLFKSLLPMDLQGEAAQRMFPCDEKEMREG